MVQVTLVCVPLHIPPLRFTAAGVLGTAHHRDARIISTHIRFQVTSKRKPRNRTGRRRTETSGEKAVFDGDTTEVLNRVEVLEAFAHWAMTEAESPIPELVIRGALLTRLLGEACEANEQLRRLGVERPSVLPGELTSSEPLPEKLASLVEQQVHLRHALACSTLKADDGATHAAFLLPWWLAAYSKSEGRVPDSEVPIRRSLHVRFSGDKLVVEDPLTEAEPAGDALRAIRLRRKAPSKWRRQSIQSTAAATLDELKVILGAPPSDSGWLERMAETPHSAEREAIHLWNDTFLPHCRIPPSFQKGMRALSLADMRVLRRGAEGGRHRLSFAEQHPWAARLLLDGPRPDEALEPIDNNPSASISVAARQLCCSRDSACPKAIRFAKLIPRHRHKAALDRLLGRKGSRTDNQVRNILLQAHSDDGELLSHIGDDVGRTRAQIGRAIEVLFAYRDEVDGGFACAYSIATLLVRLFVRSAFDPRAVNPEEVAAGLAAFSADSLAAFAADRLRRRATSLAEPDADTLDTGVLAFLAYVGETRRPRLTMRQLTRFTEVARNQSVHTLAVVKPDIDEEWSLPEGWTAKDQSTFAGAAVTPLTSFEAMKAEGDRMHNCLREGRYQRAAVLGRLALFSIEAADGRATLALGPDERQLGYITWLDGWSMEQLRAADNDDPSPGCEEAANALLHHLNRQCPFALSRGEVRRRTRVQRALDGSRSFNPDTEVAEERWSELYAKYLPRSFRTITPRMIVEQYLRSSPERDPE